jgi:hypothetical protein
MLLFIRGADGHPQTWSFGPFGESRGAVRITGRALDGVPAASWAADGEVADAVGIGADGLVYRARYLWDTGWEPWANSPIASATVPVAVAAGDGVARPQDARLFMRGNDGAGYVGDPSSDPSTVAWSPLDRAVADAPAGAWSTDAGELLAVAHGGGGGVVWRRWERGLGWRTWTALAYGPQTISAPTVSRSDRLYTIGVRAADGAGYLFDVLRGADGPTPSRRIGGPLLGSPAISSERGGAALDVAAVGTDHRVYRRRYLRGRGWGAWRQASGGLVATSATVGLARNERTGELALLARGANGEGVFEVIRPGARVTVPWTPMHQPVLGAPSGSWSPGGTRLSLAAVGRDFAVWRSTFVRGSGLGAWTQAAAAGSAPLLALPAHAPASPAPVLGGEDGPRLAVGAPTASGVIAGATPSGTP